MCVIILYIRYIMLFQVFLINQTSRAWTFETCIFIRA